MSELYPAKWVKADDLQGHAVTVRVSGVAVEEFRTPGGEMKEAAVLFFEGKAKRLILNKTQCRALAEIAGSERFADWIGQTVQLAPGRAANGKPTIIIGKAGDGGTGQ